VSYMRFFHHVAPSTSLPPISPFPSLAQTFLVWRWPHRFLEWHWRRYGSRFTIRTIGLPPLVFFSDEADIRAIITAPADILYPGAGTAVITPLVGEHSFIRQENAEHMDGRRAIMPAFHHRAVAEHTAMIHHTIENEIASWPSDEPFAVHSHLLSFTLNVILTTIFGGRDRRLVELHNRLLTMFSIADSLMLQEPQLRNLPGWRGMWARFCAERTEVDRLIYGLIEDDTCHAERHSALSLMRRAIDSNATSFTTQEVRDGIMSMILAGHEDTAAQLAWAFQLIAHHPRVLNELLDEVDRDEETYLEATIQEVMRHRPVFLFTIPRVVHRDFEIAGTTFRPPAYLMGCIHLMHHDPRLYSDPHSFRPERFLDSPPNPHLWLPWGGGHRRCPGRHLALLEMRVVLRAVLLRWEVLPAARSIETARWRSVIVTPGHGSRVVLRTRHRRIRTSSASRRSYSQPPTNDQQGTWLPDAIKRSPTPTHDPIPPRLSSSRLKPAFGGGGLINECLFLRRK
jgi:cytochrome P450